MYSTRLVPEPGKFYFEGKGLLKTDETSNEYIRLVFIVNIESDLSVPC